MVDVNEDEHLNWSLSAFVQRPNGSSQVFKDHQALINAVLGCVQSRAKVVVMSNGGFASMPKRLLAALVENRPGSN